MIAAAPAQRAGMGTQVTAAVPQAPGLRRELVSEAVSVEGLIRLDVTVADETGKAFTGLKRTDFRVRDNGQTREIIAFREPNGVPADRDSLAVILLVDTLDLPPDLAALEREQAARFLRQNAGRLREPVTVYLLEDSGFFLAANPTTDGEALAGAVDSDSKINAFFLAPHVGSLFKGTVTDSSLLNFPALAGLRALATIAGAEDRKPGRKLLLWLGPGPSKRATDAHAPYAKGVINYSSFGEHHDAVIRDLFRKFVWFSTLLRQARITLDCILTGELETTSEVWMQHLADVPSAHQAKWTDLFKGNLAVQSGGRVVIASDDPVRQMNDFVESVQTSYTLTFDPPLATHADDYHTLKVEMSRPGLIARTSSGYYDQPFYDDPLDPEIRHVTMAQLQQILLTAYSGASAERELASLALTERLSRAELHSLSQELHGKIPRDSLEMIADQSAFLDPPPSEILADPPPDEVEQQRIIAGATEYLSQVIPKLPDFFATRIATYFREVVPYPGLDSKAVPEPLHAEQERKETVLYRDGREVVDHPQPVNPSAGDASMNTYGTFGPALSMLLGVLKFPGGITWKAWEKSGTGRFAVFNYANAGSPAVNLTGCCFPDGGEKALINISADSRGEIVIDPASGAISLIQIENDLRGFVPTKRSDLVVGYGPVEINGKTYILPQYGVGIMRDRSVVMLPEWNVAFPTWGPYETHMNVFTFDHYHRFLSNARVLPGFEPAR